MELNRKRKTGLLRRVVLALATSLPLCAAEVYGFGGYAHAGATNNPSWFSLPAQQSIAYGAGIGGHIWRPLGIGAEFIGDRGSAGFGAGSSHSYSGFSLNVFLDIPGGPARPYFAAGGGLGSLEERSGSTSAEHYGVLTVLAGGGVTVRLAGRLFLRPQLRYHYRQEFSIFGSSGAKLPSPLSVVVALGLKF